MQDPNLPVRQSRPLPATTESADPWVPGGGGSGASPFMRLRAAIVRYRWMLLATAALGTAAGIWASRFLPPEYDATATLWIHVPDRNSESQGPIRSSVLFDERSWIELMRNSAVLLPAVHAERLYLSHDPADQDVLAGLTAEPAVQAGTYRLVVGQEAGGIMELRSEDDTVLDRRRAGESIGQSVGLNWTPDVSSLLPGRVVTFSVTSPGDAAGALNGALSVNLGGGRFLNVRYRDRDPVKAARVVNTLTEQYVALSADLKRAQLVELRDTLDSQLGYARAQLEQAELQLNDFQVRTITAPTATAAPVSSGTESTRASALDNYFDLKITRDQHQQDLESLNRIMASSQGGISLDALSGVPAVTESPELSQALREVAEKRVALRTLRQQFTDEHDGVRRAMADLAHLEEQVVPRLAYGLMSVLRNRISQTDGLVASASADLQGIPPRAIEEARLQRSVYIAEKLYTTLRERYENARLATETSVADVQILSRATPPETPSSDTRNRMLVMACLASLGLGLGLVFVRDRSDPSIQYPHQVSQGLRLAILGAIPDMQDRGSYLRKGHTEVELLEALRGVRLNVEYAHGAAGPMLLTITSPGPGDGKTFVASHLGSTFASQGYSTLIIDGDTRRGTLHRVLEVDRRPGLTDLLGGDAELSEVVRRTAVPNLDTIPSGARHSRTPEMLASARMGELLASLKGRYQVILIDSPPLGSGVDPLVLSTLSGNVLLVVRPGVTNRSLAEAKLDVMDQLPVRVLGAVLNSVGGGAAFRYYSYLPGYETGVEIENGAGRQLNPA